MPSPRHAITSGGLICTSDARASRAGIDVMDAGGSCIDAALAAAAVLNVVEPFNSHLGGDAFLLYWSAAQRSVTAVNGSGAAPFSAQPADFARGIPLRGLRAATVPGQVHAWLTAHQRWGRLPLARLFEPAIAHAEEGFEVSDMLAKALKLATDCYDQPGFAAQFLPGGQPLGAGATLRQPNVARALRLVAQDGLEAYYAGPIAEALVALSHSLGGWFEPQDLASHRTWIQQPISYRSGDWTVLEQPAPSQGVIVLQCLAIARQLGIRHLDFGDPQRVHLMIEALKSAYADRFRWWADPAFCRLPTERMLSDEYAAERAGRIDHHRASTYEAGALAAGKDTTYLCAIDPAGNAVSFIQSVFHSFGCGVVEPTFGILLNNRMNGFSTEKGHPNAVYPGKRPVHTLNTWMVLRDGAPVLAGGTPGGPSQVQWNFQLLSNLLDRGMDLEQAITAPRWAWQDGLRIIVEADFGDGVLSTLKAAGHNLQVVAPGMGGGRVQLIRIDSESGQREGCGESRIDSCVLATKQ